MFLNKKRTTKKYKNKISEKINSSFIYTSPLNLIDLISLNDNIIPELVNRNYLDVKANTTASLIKSVLSYPEEYFQASINTKIIINDLIKTIVLDSSLPPLGIFYPLTTESSTYIQYEATSLEFVIHADVAKNLITEEIINEFKQLLIFITDHNNKLNKINNKKEELKIKQATEILENNNKIISDTSEELFF